MGTPRSSRGQDRHLHGTRRCGKCPRAAPTRRATLCHRRREHHRAERCPSNLHFRRSAVGPGALWPRIGARAVARGPGTSWMNDPRLSAAPVVEPRARRISVTGVVFVILLAAAVAGTALLMRARSRAASATATDSARAIADRVIPVLTAPVVRRDVPVWLEGLGSVSAFYTVTVRPQVDGRIERVLFKEGQNVRKGDVLVQIDSRPFTIQLQSAMAGLERDQAQLKNGQLNLERYKTLSAQNLISQQQFTDQQATVAQLQGQVSSDQALISSAKLNLDYARITSPIDGVAGVRLVDPGNVVRSTDATRLVVVTQLDPIAVFFTLPEDHLAPIQQAMAKEARSVEV